MNHSIMLNFGWPTADNKLSRQDVYEQSQERLRILGALNKLEGDDFDFSEEVRWLAADASNLVCALNEMPDGEYAIPKKYPARGPSCLLSHARVLRGVLSVGASSNVDFDTLSNFAYALELDLERVLMPEMRDGEEDPISPAALEKTIGLDGLRRLHWAINSDIQAVLNFIEWHVENQEGVPFYGEEATPEARAAEKEKVDYTKPLGYYDQEGEPVKDDDEDLGPDDDASMLLDSIMAAVPEDDLRRLRIAAFDHHDDLTRVLTAFLGEHAGASLSRRVRHPWRPLAMEPVMKIQQGMNHSAGFQSSTSTSLGHPAMTRAVPEIFGTAA